MAATPHHPPSPAAAVAAELRARWGCERVRDDPATRVAYSFDASPVRRLPDLVVFPETTEEVAQVLAACDRHGLPVFVRGGGTGLAGGSVPDGGVALVTTRMNRILWVDEANLQMRVQAGVVTAEVHRAARARGLMFPPDPGSASVCTIGGNIACDAAGSRAFHYGTTRRYVLGLQVVLADGRVLETGARTAKNATGLDLTHWFVGSEGLLGVITEATLRLVPAPEASATVQAVFEDLAALGSAVVAAARSPARPAALELFDGATLRVVEDYLHAGLPTGCAGMLLALVEGRQEAVERQARELAELLARHGAASVRTARDPAEQEVLWRARHAVAPAVARIKPTKISEDVCVPVAALPEFMAAVQELARRLRLDVVLFGHAGDGNLHPNILCDERDTDEMARVQQAVDELFALALRLGGTLSGEHGTGLLKAPYLPQAVDPVNLELQQAVKRLLDPKGLLNPGKVFGGAGAALPGVASL